MFFFYQYVFYATFHFTVNVCGVKIRETSEGLAVCIYVNRGIASSGLKA